MLFSYVNEAPHTKTYENTKALLAKWKSALNGTSTLLDIYYFVIEIYQTIVFNCKKNHIP